MGSDEDVIKRDAEATRYFNESDKRTSKQSFQEDLEELEEHHFEEQQEQEEEQQSEQDEDINSQQMAAEDEEAESFHHDIDVHKAVESDQEIEQQLSRSSSGSWESGNEDDKFDDRHQGSVTVVRETTADIPVNRLMVVPDTDRRQKQQSAKMSLRG